MLKPDAKVLIADDSRVARIALAHILAALGYEHVLQAADGAEAVAMHAEHRPDCIFLDIVMPTMRGDVALERIRASDRVTPVFMLSSISKQSEIEHCRKLGIAHFFIKPLVAESAIAQLREQLARL